MKKHKKNDNEEPEIELVSIEDLRTAMGGVTVGPARPTPQIDPSDLMKTTMCSGWSRHIPIPGQTQF